MSKMKRMLCSRAALALVAWVAYALVFIPLHRLVGLAVAALAILPVVVMGWLFGMRSGLLAGLLTFPLNILLTALVTGTRWYMLTPQALFGTVLILLIGGVVGRLHDLGEQVTWELAERKRAEEELRKHRDHLEELVGERTSELRRTNEELQEEITERKQAEEALAKERNLLRTIIDNLPDSIYVKDAESRYSVSNTAHMRFLGATTPDEVVGKSVFELFPQELAEQYYADDQKVIQSGQPLLKREERSVDQAGNSVWNLTTRVPLRDSYGKIIGIVGVARDITERKRAEEEIKRHALQLATLHEASAVIASRLTLQEIFNAVVQSLSEAFGYRLTAIYLLEEGVLELKAHVGYGSPPDCAVAHVPVGRGVVGRTVRTGQPQLVTNVEEDPDFFYGVAGITSEVAVPLKRGDEVLGVLTVESNRVDKPLDTTDLQLLTLLSNHVVIAIEHARLFGEAKERTESLSALYGIGKEINASLELDRILEVMCDEVMRTTGVAIAEVSLVDLEQGTWEMKVIQGYSENWKGRVFSLDTGITGRVARTGESVIIPDVRQTEGYLGDPRIRSELTVPILLEERVVGVVNVESTELSAFDEEDLRFMQALADQAAIAIKNARLYEAAQRELVERKRAEEALRVSEERFALAVQGSNDGIWDWDIQNNSLYWSPRMKELLGYAVDELDVDFDTLNSLLHPDDREHTNAAIEAHLKDRVSFDVEQRMCTKSGEYRWFLARGQAVWDEDGQPIRMVGSTTDITERKAAEEALRESEERFRLTVEATRDGLWENSFDHTRDFFSDRMFTMLGYEPVDPVYAYDFFDSLRHPDDIENHEKMLKMINKPGHDDYSVEMRFKAKDGTWHHILSRGKCVERDEEGKWMRFVGTHTDITDLKQAEGELRRLKEFNEGIVQGMEEGIVIEDADGRITFVNPKMAETLGYTEEELVGKHWSEIVAPSCLRQVQEESSKRAEGISSRYEVALLRKDGKEVSGLVSARPLLREGVFAGTLAVFTDLTEVRKMEQQVAQSGKLAAIGQLVAGVAHELNNPLTSVIGYSQLLMKAQCSEEIKRDLDRINRQAQRAARIVENLLTFARRREPRKESINLNDVVERSLELQALQLDRISVVKELDEALPSTLADPFQMQQVFMNIIGNAHQVLRDWGGEKRLRVGSGLAGGMIHLEFADSGPGIPSQVMERLFEPFFTTREIGEGTGLGLSISYGIVEAHGGRIWAQSEVGKGSTFIVEIPVQGV
jgi:PAS domain S-box-containing protein